MAKFEEIKSKKKLAEAGIQSGVDFTPIIPFILDDDDNIREVIERASQAGANYILPGSGMTLRSNQKIRFIELLKENWPGLVKEYEKLYRESQNPPSEYVKAINRKAFGMCKEFGIPTYITPPVLEVPFKENLEVANLLLLIAYFSEKRSGSYAAWAYHKAAQNIEDLNENIRDIHKKGELENISGIGKIISKIIAEFLDSERSKKLEELESEW